MKDHKSIESGNITASLEDDELPFEREEKVTAEKLKFESGRIAMATIGALVYAIGING